MTTTSEIAAAQAEYASRTITAAKIAAEAASWTAVTDEAAHLATSTTGGAPRTIERVTIEREADLVVCSHYADGSWLCLSRIPGPIVLPEVLARARRHAAALAARFGARLEDFTSDGPPEFDEDNDEGHSPARVT